MQGEPLPAIGPIAQHALRMRTLACRRMPADCSPAMQETL